MQPTANTESLVQARGESESASRVPTVAAVIVTHNRKELLGQCLEAVLSQSRPVDKVIVIDNCSTDGTPSLLQERGFLDTQDLDYVRLQENLGSSGGFYEGMKRAYAGGFHWLWMMDDDCLPASESLQHLSLAAESAPHCIYGPRNIDADTGDDVWYRWPAQETDLMGVRSVAFNGLFIPRAVVTAAGLPFRDLRICADDVEYCQRARARGYTAVIVRSAVVYHPKPTLFEWGSVAGRPLLTYPKYRSPERVYYHLRNWTYVLLRHWRTFGTFASVAQLRIMACLVCFGQISPKLAFRAVAEGTRLLSAKDGAD